MNGFRPFLPFVYRDSSAGWLAGVCAGLSEATGIKKPILRASFLLGTYVYPLLAVPAYLLAIALLRDRARSGEADDQARAPPPELNAPQPDALLLKQRLASLEAEVASGDAELRRRFRDAGLA
jgi:phage shock protein PspC (stress-responsive transcriptional regulator)